MQCECCNYNFKGFTIDMSIAKFLTFISKFMPEKYKKSKWLNYQYFTYDDKKQKSLTNNASPTLFFNK